MKIELDIQVDQVKGREEQRERGREGVKGRRKEGGTEERRDREREGRMTRQRGENTEYHECLRPSVVVAVRLPTDLRAFWPHRGVHILIRNQDTLSFCLVLILLALDLLWVMALN